jgi:hypothetical protein
MYSAIAFHVVEGIFHTVCHSLNVEVGFALLDRCSWKEYNRYEILPENMNRSHVWQIVTCKG